MSDIWIYGFSHVCLSILHGKDFSVGHYMQAFQPNFFMHAMLVGTISFYHLIPFSLILTLSWCHKVSIKVNLLISFSGTILTDQDDMWYCVGAIQLDIMSYLFDKGNNCLFFYIIFGLFHPY